MSMTWITFKCQSFQLQVSKLIVTVIHYSVFFYYCKHIGYVFIVSLNVSTHYQHLVFFYKRATMHGKWRVIYRPIFILSLLYRYSCPSVLSISWQLISQPPRGTGYATGRYCCLANNFQYTSTILMLVRYEYAWRWSSVEIGSPCM